MTDYSTLNRQLAALVHGVPHRIANLANAAALLYHTLDELNWAGFYLLEGDTLVLGPFQGKPACIEIAPGRGVCGAAAAQDKTQLIPDVHQFPGHIACDSASNSELVLFIENTTDRAITVQARNVLVNWSSVDVTFSAEVLAGRRSAAAVTLAGVSLADIREIYFYLRVTDRDRRTPLFDTAPVTIIV